MEEKKPLSQYGIGPFYALSVFVMTLAALVLDHFDLLPSVRFKQADILLKFLSAVFMIEAGILWTNAVFIMKISQHIRKNELATKGAYAYVRNPIYSAIMLLMWGVLWADGNLFLLILCPIYHLLMTIMVKCTEEKWLSELYKEEYTQYCKRVNRCIPWFPKVQKDMDSGR